MTENWVSTVSIFLLHNILLGEETKSETLDNWKCFVSLVMVKFFKKYVTID